MRRVFLLLLFIASTALGQGSASREERAANRLRRVIEILRFQPGAAIADIGCGDGAYTIPLARAVGPRGKVFAVDISAAELAKLRANVTKREPLPRAEQTKYHRLAPGLARLEVERAGFQIVELRDPFDEIPPDQNGPLRWWLLIARKPASGGR